LSKLVRFRKSTIPWVTFARPRLEQASVASDRESIQSSVLFSQQDVLGGHTDELAMLAKEKLGADPDHQSRAAL
jgi:hypothetical protein